MVLRKQNDKIGLFWNYLPEVARLGISVLTRDGDAILKLSRPEEARRRRTWTEQFALNSESASDTRINCVLGSYCPRIEVFSRTRSNRFDDRRLFGPLWSGLARLRFGCSDRSCTNSLARLSAETDASTRSPTTTASVPDLLCCCRDRDVLMPATFWSYATEKLDRGEVRLIWLPGGWMSSLPSVARLFANRSDSISLCSGTMLQSWLGHGSPGLKPFHRVLVNLE